ncbi:MAG: aminotransferase class III-fold pyridoxal phosphate-dependent enzyme [Candidatus Baldrarchaeia archaeon]
MLNNVGVVLPKEGYLRDVRKLTEEYNVLLIFDEVKTGVRLTPVGAAEYFKIEPDIVTLAKAIDGGAPPRSIWCKKRNYGKCFSTWTYSTCRNI